MQKNYFKVAVIVVIASYTLIACGGSKQMSSSSQNKVVAQNPCEQLQEEKTALRAVGKGTNFREQTAKNIAEMQARSQFARSIASKITTATSEEALGFDLFSSDVATGNVATDQGAKQNDFSQSIAEGVVKNTVVIRTYKEQRPDNQFDIWVCLEYQGDVAKMANEIAKTVQQRVPDAQRAKMNAEFDQFRKRVETELEKSR
ncbi:MAG: hypothetical protein LBM07_02175 [Culturomica sp.]|jgi:uncharacterized alkaline shock family protein YloU|nr:hypothetical protein [Culturomica sp.]